MYFPVLTMFGASSVIYSSLYTSIGNNIYILLMGKPKQVRSVTFPKSHSK